MVKAEPSAVVNRWPKAATSLARHTCNHSIEPQSLARPVCKKSTKMQRSLRKSDRLAALKQIVLRKSSVEGQSTKGATADCTVNRTSIWRTSQRLTRSMLSLECLRSVQRLNTQKHRWITPQATFKTIAALPLPHKAIWSKFIISRAKQMQKRRSEKSLRKSNLALSRRQKTKIQ